MQKQDAWARFWRGGSLTSFGDTFSEGYRGELRQLWMEFLASLPDAAVVADLGAGNGALEEIAESHAASSGRHMHVHAFDLAPVQPARFSKQSSETGFQVSWHAATANEDTGLDANSVDAVIGNYAFEYGNDELTIAEIGRILKSDGRCRFLMHHAESNIILNAKNEYAVLEAELAKGGFLDSVRDYLREFGEIRKPGQFEKMKASGHAEPYRRRMNDEHTKAVRLATMQNAVILIEQIMRWTGQLVSPPMFFEPKQVLLQRLKEIREELAANRSRLKDMQAAGVDELRIQKIIRLFESHGMQAEATLYRVTEEPVPVGWQVDIRRN